VDAGPRKCYTLDVTAPVGADIESLCSKCGDVWHVVVAKVGDRIARVLCKQCGKQHRHKPPGPPEATPRAKAAAGAIPQSPPARPKSASPRSRSKEPPPPPGPTVAFDPSRPSRPYRATEQFQPGDRIDHPSFGQGIVEMATEPGKITVYFPSGRRVLAQARAASALERPRPLIEAIAPSAGETEDS
jgi:hypothetical protein